MSRSNKQPASQPSKRARPERKEYPSFEIGESSDESVTNTKKRKLQEISGGEEDLP